MDGCISKYLTFALFSIFCFKVSVLAEENLSKPTAIFQGSFWKKYKVQLIYAPWGNGNEVNATTRNLRIGFSSPSKEFAYYGDDNLAFYPVNIDEEEGKRIGNGKSCRIFLTAKKDILQRYLLLFLKGNLHRDLSIRFMEFPFRVRNSFWVSKFFSQFPRLST